MRAQASLAELRIPREYNAASDLIELTTHGGSETRSGEILAGVSLRSLLSAARSSPRDADSACAPTAGWRACGMAPDRESRQLTLRCTLHPCRF